MVSTEKDPRRDFHHRWWPEEYLVLLQVCGDHREETCANISVRHTLVACVLECALNRGLEVPDTAYEHINKTLADGIRDA